MECMHFIVDIRKDRADGKFVVSLATRFTYGYPGATTGWVLRPDQAHLVSPQQVIAQAAPNDLTWTAGLSGHFFQFMSAHNNRCNFFVLSYDNNVLSHAHALTSQGMVVNTKHLGELYKMIRQLMPELSATPSFRSGFPPRPGSAGPLTNPNWMPTPNQPGAFVTPPIVGAPTAPTSCMPLEEAVELAKRLLLERGHTGPETALEQKALRSLMTSADPRSARIPGDPMSESLIFRLIDHALQAGWLKRRLMVPGRTGTEAIYVDTTKLGGAAQNSQPPQPSAILAPSESTPKGESAQVSQEAPKSSAPAETGSVTANPEDPVQSAKPSKHLTRAADMEAVHRAEGIGSLRETRDLFFEAVENILSQGTESSPTVVDLFHKAEQLAKTKAEETNYTNERNWSVARRCMQNLFVRAQVLRDDADQVITEGFGDESRRVASLDPDYRQLCHGYLAETVIRKLGNIHYKDDYYYLGLTLFRRGKANAVAADELKRMADEVLMFLYKKGRIERDGNQVRLRSTPALVKGFGT